MSVQQIVEAGRIAPDQLTGKSWRIKIIEGDRQGSSAWYPKEALDSGKGLFTTGIRIYKNHPSAEEKFSRPERSVDDIIGYLSENAEYDGKDLYAKATFFPEYQEFVKSRAEAGVIGMSIRAEGEMAEGDNGPVLERFTAVHSVDVVTTPGAGGGFDTLLESERKISASESDAESHKKEEQMELPKELTAALDALVESSKKNAEAVARLVERADKEDQEKADLAEAARKEAEDAEKAPEVDPLAVAKQLAESGLAPAAQARVLDSVKGGKELAEAITAEKEYSKTILEEAGKNFSGREVTDLQEAKKSIGASIYGD
jgi:hypothetical protein